MGAVTHIEQYPMSHRAQGPDFDWFGAGWSAFHFPVHPDAFPPLDDREAQRAWLAGFGAAWAECPEAAQRENTRSRFWLCERTVTAALKAVLAGRTELLRQLQLIGMAATPTWH
jgi:hypothetical protein